MADRTDIDALLVGALYGELTPADEARLAAHLEAHPADRTALTDLTRTRDAVRESRIVAEQADPPQAISALLLQEASRRAPRPSRDPDSLSWFQRLFRSTLVAHPAMSAAATLVLVVGIGGTLYLRGEANFAESDRPVTTAAATNTASAPVVPSTAAASPDEARAADNPPAPASPPSAGAAGAAAGAGSYRVDVDQVGDGKSAAARTAATEPSEPPVTRTEAARESATEPARKELATAQRGDDAANQKPAAAAPSKPRGIELRSPEPQPKELPDRDSARAARDRQDPYDAAAAVPPPVRNSIAAPSPGQGTATKAAGRGRAADEESRAPAVAPSSAERASDDALASPPPPPAAAPSPAEPKLAPLRNTKRAPATKAAPSNSESAPVPPANAAKPPANTALSDSDKFAKRAPLSAAGNVTPGATASSAAGNASPRAASPPSGAPAAQDRRASNAGNNLLSNDKTASDPAVLDWARKQRDQVVSLVAANNCRAAAARAVEIYRRAPDYYAANIVTDRAIRPCLAYVNNERERDDRNRAVRNNTNNDAPANAAPPVRK